MIKNKVSVNRNYGIDLLKMFSMFLVVVLHVLGQGGILYKTEVLSLNYNVAWTIELVAYCAVNCFALASGYIGIDVNYKFSRIINLWFTTVFYGVLANIVFTFAGVTLTSQMWKAAFMPFLYGNMSGFYWYFTAYAVTFLFIPFLNYLINNLNQKQATLLVCGLLFIFSIVPTIKNLDYFKTYNGYSYAWISTLYILGAYIKKFNIGEKLKTSSIFVLTIASNTMTCISHIILDYINVKVLGKDITGEVDFVSNTYALDSNYLSGGIIAKYTFPLIVINSVLLLLLFSRIKIKNTKVQTKIKEFSLLTFSVYLIHTNKLVFDNVIFGLFEGYKTFNAVFMILAILSSALAIYVICTMIDMIRFELFKLIRINKFSDFISTKLLALFNKLYYKLIGD